MHTSLIPLAVPDIEQYLRLLHLNPTSNTPILPVQLLSTYVTIPSRATEQSAGLNLYASFPATIPPHSSSPINTHIAIAIPTGHYRRVAPQSGLAFKSGVTAFGGTIDADYRGKLKVLLRNDSDQEFKVWVGDRISQLIIKPYAEVTPMQATTLGSTSDSKEFPVEMLIDSEATVSLVSEEFVKANGLKIIKTSTTTLLQNANGSLNSRITHLLSLSLFLDGQFIPFSFYIAKIPMHTSFFLGHNFLVKFNPTIDWQTGQILSVHLPPLSSLLDYEKGDQIIGDTLTPIHTLDIPEEYREFFPVFEKEGFDQLPKHSPRDHAIEFIPGSKLRNCKVYNLLTPEQKALKEFLKENLKMGWIRPSKSPMASPFFFIKKKDGSLRPVQDYRYLNSIIIKNRYPLPLISEIINKLKGASVFTKFDVRWGYNNIRIKEGDEWKAAFHTNMGLYEPLVIFFGLTNSPATFQSIMNDIFQEEIEQGFVIVYINNILIFSKSEEEHQEHVIRVLRKLRDNNLFLKPSKCEFHKITIPYLGFILGQGKISMEQEKVNAVTQMANSYHQETTLVLSRVYQFLPLIHPSLCPHF
ncbi:hypothetical protein AX16_008987 [Volvariella volvacea WC 439]|nr:hypothetical protein AX16_008987 [Volvariella volvacea WC 439]